MIGGRKGREGKGRKGKERKGKERKGKEKEREEPFIKIASRLVLNKK